MRYAKIEKEILEILQQEFAHLNMVQACKAAERIARLQPLPQTEISDDRLKETIENALYSTGKFTTDDCEILTEGIIQNIKEVSQLSRIETEKEQPTLSYMQIIEQTDEENLAMYMKCEKQELAKMLIQCNKLMGEKIPEIQIITGTVYNAEQPVSEPESIKSAEEVLRNNMNESLWKFINDYPVAYKSEVMLKDWIVDAMEEYTNLKSGGK
jgi:hypothetical protein